MYFRNKSHNLIALVFILVACRKLNLGITLKKIIKKANLKSKTKLINKCLITLKRILPKDINCDSKPINFLSKLSQKL